jgi:dihydroorotate dehydrogenase
VNISSPNTPGLRNLQAKEQLKVLLGAAKKARDDIAVNELNKRKPPLLVKIAPDMNLVEMKDIAEVVSTVSSLEFVF